MRWTLIGAQSPNDDIHARTPRFGHHREPGGRPREGSLVSVSAPWRAGRREFAVRGLRVGGRADPARGDSGRLDGSYAPGREPDHGVRARPVLAVVAGHGRVDARAK